MTEVHITTGTSMIPHGMFACQFPSVVRWAQAYTQGQANLGRRVAAFHVEHVLALFTGPLVISFLLMLHNFLFPIYHVHLVRLFTFPPNSIIFVHCSSFLCLSFLSFFLFFFSFFSPSKVE